MDKCQAFAAATYWGTCLSLRVEGLQFDGSSVLLGQNLLLEVLREARCGGHPLHTHPPNHKTSRLNVSANSNAKRTTRGFVPGIGTNESAFFLFFSFFFFVAKIAETTYLIFKFLTTSRVRNTASPVSVFQLSAIDLYEKTVEKLQRLLMSDQPSNDCCVGKKNQHVPSDCERKPRLKKK